MYDSYQNMLTFIILIFTYFLVFSFCCRQKRDIKVITLLFLWHSFFSFVYYSFTLSNPADAIGYYRRSFYSDFVFYPGTPFIVNISSMFTKTIEASYLNVTLIFNIFGLLGLAIFYLTIKGYLKEMSRYWVMIFFIPSMSFWSAGLGKDAISFFSTCLFLYAIAIKKRNFLLISISFFFMFMVRPHIAFMMLISYIVYFIIKAKINLVFKLLTLPVIAIGLVVSLSFVQQYVGLEDASLGDVGDYVDGRQNVNQGGGSSVDIASMSYPMQMFTYVFRPLPFEAHSAVALFSSIENTIILFLFIYIVYKSKFNFRSFIYNENLWLFTYVFLTCTILALTTANLGIATRQKWMFMPVLIYLLIYAFYKYKINNTRIYK
ncbi:hypothetical protein [Psychrobacter urativorans]|nr:hypothetical protein [Psychrobacter urativorans]